MCSYVPRLTILIKHGFAEWFLLSGFFLSTRSRPNVASAVYSRTCLNGELAEVLLRVTCSASVGSSGAGGCCGNACFGVCVAVAVAVLSLALESVAVGCGREG